MNKTLTKVLALVMVLAMVLSLCACGAEPAAPAEEPAAPAESEETAAPVEVDTRLAAEVYTTENVDFDAYTATSEEIYADVLGDFLATYNEAKAASTIAERYALMAVAEAKLIEAGIFFPTSSNGGNYSLGRNANYTVSPCLWGNDEYRLHQLVITTDLIKAEYRTEMRAKWNELRGTGEYEQWVKDFLVEKGYTLTDEYAAGYSSDPKTWDCLATSRQADTEPIVNLFDGLMEYDIENVQQPALATGYEMSEDGLTYTFTLRDYVWTDSQGRKVADGSADDFVAGMQHMMDTMGGLEYLVQGVILNADEYINGEVTDFAEVGVKALDEHTLQYTLCQDTPYFLTMLSYSVFAPMCRSYYESQGGKFGAEFDASAADYLYGTSPDNIAYNGPFVITNWTSENSITFKANASYWNADKINLHTINWYYNDGTDATKAYNDMKNGTLTSCGLNSAALEACKADGLFDEYVGTSLTDATAFMGFFNLNRTNYANINDGAAASTMTVNDADRTNAAMKNLHFRRALMLSLDRKGYNAQTVGDDLALVSLVNSYTPGTFVTMPEDVTIDGLGTFAAGTYYGEIMQAQIDADGLDIKVWDAENQQSNGFDGWYNPEAAAEELALAVEELAAEGIEISAENPIYIDLPCFTGSDAYSKRANVLKQSVEAATNGLMIVNLVECVDSSTWYYAGYYTDYGYEANYTVYDVSGWGPDYGDPQTYLDTMLDEYAGYMVKCLGIF